MIVKLGVYIFTFLVAIFSSIYLMSTYVPLSKFYSIGSINISLLFTSIILFIINVFTMNKALVVANVLIVWIMLYRFYFFSIKIDLALEGTAATLRYYHQCDRRWKRTKYASGTIGSKGCAIAVGAMIVSSLTDFDITPLKAADFAAKHSFATTGTEIEFFYKYLSLYNIKYQVIPKYYTSYLRKYLEKSWWIIAIVRMVPSKKTHCVIIREIEGDRILLADPANISKSMKYYGLDKFLEKCTTSYPYIAVKAVKDRQR